MKTALFLIVAALVGVTGAHASVIDLGTFLVSPQGNFLYNSPGDNCSASYAVAGCNMTPIFINLAPYIGDTITVTDVGSLCLYSGSNCTEYPASASYLGGVFDTNTILLDPSNINRLPGAVSSGLPNISTPNLNSHFGNVDTTMPYDFFLPQTNLVVAAQYLVVGALDSLYSDNSGTNPPTFGVHITVDPPDPTPQTPEPGTAALFVMGGVGLWAFCRKFPRQA